MTLSKQMDFHFKSDIMTNILSFLMPDIELKFNFNHFVFDMNAPIGPKELDFRLFFAREITKALGFQSGLKRYGLSKRIIAPTRRYVTLKEHMKGSKTGSYMGYVTPFDSILYSTMPKSRWQQCLEFVTCKMDTEEFQSIAEITRKLEPFQYLVGTLNSIVSLNSEPNFMEPASKLFTLFKSPNLAARFKDGSQLKMDNFAMGYVSRNLFQSSEFLMTPLIK